MVLVGITLIVIVLLFVAGGFYYLYKADPTKGWKK